ncbi:hypothetical protein [Cellulomonas shaoxiangyii]|uniref:Type VII secretion integral membrane protein EccD n=1 Tax=Cellulomonas shaoxiangyii TaxID=2566013 RepID=A0A4P7SL70_9CELL|nr:hypothetical protein [Cellulomonas shaoxiangyii]QCB94237.1 hypothetical protein E5225_12370 [Cellulomonas shaoxiangyii]TGY76597.1 hypothetical protein E5226_17555 [Cellulomonas shaoxiangyii]
MSTAPPRRFAVLDGDRRLDVALPATGTLGDALGAAGVLLDDPRLTVLVGDRPADRATPVTDLEDGVLLTVVDPVASVPDPRRAARARRVAGRGADTAAWWALLALAAVAAALDVAAPGLLDHRTSLLVAALLGVAALGTAALAARRSDDLPAPLRVATPVALVVGAALTLVPDAWYGASVLDVLTAAMTVGVLGVAGVALADAGPWRAAFGAVAAIAAGVAAVWGLTLLLGWPVQAAAAITAGAVPVALRAVPAALLQIDEGYFMDYARYLRNRWSVRGTVPADPGPIDGADIRAHVAAASAARVTATVALALVGALALPAAVPVHPAGGFVVGGTVALVLCYLLGLLLLQRTESMPALRWVVRASTVVAAVVGLRALAATAGPGTELLVAGLLALVGVGAAVVAVPLGRGARSLGLSRTGDVLQGMATVLALPAALLAAGGLELVRTAVSG